MSAGTHGVHVEADGDITHLRLDDGDRNVLTVAIVTALKARLDDLVERKAPPTVIIEGNGQALSVGLDTRTVLAGGADGKRLLGLMRGILELLYLSRLRSVVCCTGHATAAGAMLLLTADRRIGYGRCGKVGLSEVRVGLEVPALTRQLVRDRLAAPQQYAATALATLYDYPGAAQAGYFDAVLPDREAALVRAQAEASRLVELDDKAYMATKRGMRQAFADLTRAG